MYAFPGFMELQIPSIFLRSSTINTQARKGQSTSLLGLIADLLQCRKLLSVNTGIKGEEDATGKRTGKAVMVDKTIPGMKEKQCHEELSKMCVWWLWESLLE